MRKTWIPRLNALILGLLIMGGGSGLPVVDAVLHHLHGRVNVAGIHLSDPAGSTSHAERCTLGAPLPTLARSAGVHGMDLSTALPTTVLRSPEPSEPAAAPAHAPSQARAPPRTLV